MLRSVEHFTGNLPQQLNSFVGREDLVGRGRRARAIATGWSRLSGRRRRRQDEAGASRSGPSWPASSPTACGWSSWLRSARRPSVPDAIATALGITPQGDVPADRHRGRGAGGPAPPARRGQLRARLVGGRGGRHRHPRSVRDREDPRHVAGVPAGGRARRPCPCHRSRSTKARPRMRSRCSSTGPAPCGPTSGCTIRRPPRRSSRSARPSTGSRSASSWRRRGWRR